MKTTIHTILVLLILALAPVALAADKDSKPADSKPANTKSADTKSASAKSAAAKPADTKPADKPVNEKPAKPLVISRGAKVKLADYLVPGKITVFDFTSKFCPPCVRLSPKLDALHAKRDDIVVVKIDINRPGVRGIDFQSPVASQYGIDEIPHIKIYDANGKRLSQGDKAMKTLQGWISKL